ncbi:hypothetical protein JD844_023409, partial [Phrynosoma platyrhinos]
TDSSTSSSSESSGEDWLIKVCCPGARHRYHRHAKTKKRMSPQLKKSGFSDNLDEEDGETESTEWRPIPSYQKFTGVPKQESSYLEWLIRLRCPRAQMEEIPDAKQAFNFNLGCVEREAFIVNPPPPVSSSSLYILKQISKQDKKCWKVKNFRELADTKTFFHCSGKADLGTEALVNERQNVGSAQSLLEKETYFVREVDRYLKHSDFLAQRRKEMLYKKWFENVSRPLLQKIQDKIDKQSSEEIEERKRKQLSLYLNYCNKKGGAFLESYSPSSYDPFFLKTCTDIWKWRKIILFPCFQLPAGKIFSPREMNELHKLELPLLPLSRQLMSAVEWLKVPPGYMESEVRQRSRTIQYAICASLMPDINRLVFILFKRRKMIPTRNESSMDFKSWGDTNKRRASSRKPDAVPTSGSLTKQMMLGSSNLKSPIKSAS